MDGVARSATECDGVQLGFRADSVRTPRGVPRLCGVRSGLREGSVLSKNHIIWTARTARTARTERSARTERTAQTARVPRTARSPERSPGTEGQNADSVGLRALNSEPSDGTRPSESAESKRSDFLTAQSSRSPRRTPWIPLPQKAPSERGIVDLEDFAYFGSWSMIHGFGAFRISVGAVERPEWPRVS